MLSACAQLGILAAGLIARRHNAARVSMMSFSSAETRAESMCYHRRAYAPRTQVRDARFPGPGVARAGCYPGQQLHGPKLPWPKVAHVANSRLKKILPLRHVHV